MKRQLIRTLNWLLDVTGVTRRNEALVGDLAEEYRAGRSAFWYCWQTLAAILSHIDTEVRNHGILAIRAILLGWLLSYALMWVWGSVILAFVIKTTTITTRVPAFFIYARWGHYLFVYLLGAWIVARAHRGRMFAMSTLYATTVFIRLTVVVAREIYLGGWNTPSMSFLIPYAISVQFWLLAGSLLGSLADQKADCGSATTLT